jgi:hypothetical protein
LGSYSTSQYIGKHCSFPTDYFNKKKRFSLLSSSRIIIPQSQKNSSLSPLSFCPHSSTSKKMQTRERKKMEREREREEFMEERKKIDRQNRKKMETRERGREDGKKKKKI